MNKNIYVLPVSATFREIKYPERIIKSIEGLERRLKGKKLNIRIGDQLEGGTVAGVYEAKLEKQPVVVKHTENIVPKTPIDYLIMSDAHAAEIRVLKRLSASEHVKVPRILHNFPKFTTFIMEDMREEGYTLFSSLILKKKFSIKSAEHIGRALAYLIQSSRTWEEFKTNESAQLSYYERSLEMLVAYPDELERYQNLEAEFTQYSDDKEEQAELNRFFVWPDSHPKNMLVNDDGEVVFIDFGRSHWGDQRYMLPNFLAHIIVYSLVGYITKAKAEDYINRCMDAYKEMEKIENEHIFVQYLAMEVLHRANGRFIEGIETTDQKLTLQKFGRLLFDKNVKTIKTMFKEFKKMK